MAAEWNGALPETAASFAGYPLVVGERLVGVLEAYGKAPLADVPLAELSFAAKGIAHFIQRKQMEQRLLKAQDEVSRYSTDLEKLVAERTASLEKMVQQMEEFSYSISHDLRAPARAMENYALALMEDYREQLDGTARDYLERIIHNSARMDRMIQEILAYSRLSRCEIIVQPVELEALVRDLVRQHPGIHPFENGIEIRSPLGTVLGHESALIQAISNLLSNACKFVAPGASPRCKVWTERNNGHVRFCVKDNGIGIKPEHQHRLFGVFERIHGDKRYEGTGIGLAIVRRAMERMGGRVGVESDGVHGSLFWVELPAGDTAAGPCQTN
jgi:signal transduction histidine kinase